MIGHLLGAAGSVEAIFTVLALQDQIAPPTINLDNPSEDCILIWCLMRRKALIHNTHCVIHFGFGGTNGSLLFKKP